MCKRYITLLTLMLSAAALSAQAPVPVTDPVSTLQKYNDPKGRPAKNFWLKVRSDQDCLLRVDGADGGKLIAGTVRNIYLTKGPHRIEAPCTNCGAPSFTGDYQVDRTGLQTFYDISFGPGIGSAPAY